MSPPSVLTIFCCSWNDGDGLQLVAVHGGLFKLHGFGGGSHLILQGPDDAVVPAFEDGYGLVDAVVVVGLGNVMDAGRIAVVQMVLQAGPVTRHDPARADMVGPLHQFQDPVDGRRVGKGAEVAGAVAADGGGS